MVAPEELTDLIGRIEASTGFSPVSSRDRLLLETVGAHAERGVAGGMAAVVGAPGAWRLVVVAEPGGVDPADLRALLAGRDHATWWVEGATDEHDALARAAGMTRTRELHQLRRPLPVGEPVEIEVRPFRRGLDDEAWLEVNNRAFEGHPDQSDWELHDLHARMAEPWFDPDGFLLHERDGRLAGFCWTKIHADTDPPLGEIYVIGADPDHHGTGLGRQLTLAGLDWLAGQGLEHGMLYVESGNDAARRLYDRLGFELHHRDRQYEWSGPPQDVPPTPTADPIR